MNEDQELNKASKNEVHYTAYNKFFLYPAVFILGFRCLWSFFVFLKSGSFSSISSLNFFEHNFPVFFHQLYENSDWIGLKMIARLVFTLTTPEILWILIGLSVVENPTDSSTAKDSEEEIEEVVAQDAELTASAPIKNRLAKPINSASIYIEEDEFTLGNNVRNLPRKNKKTKNFKHPGIEDSFLKSHCETEAFTDRTFIDKSGVQIVDLNNISRGHAIGIRSLDKPGEIEYFDLKSTITLGNTGFCDIEWSGIEEGKLICKIIYSSSQIQVATCDSSILLNGKKFSGKKVLLHKSRVRVGRFELIYFQEGSMLSVA